jgi:hypothetical protein
MNANHQEEEAPDPQCHARVEALLASMGSGNTRAGLTNEEAAVSPPLTVPKPNEAIRASLTVALATSQAVR